MRKCEISVKRDLPKSFSLKRRHKYGIKEWVFVSDENMETINKCKRGRRMKRHLAILLGAVMTCSVVMCGCQASKGLENEYVTIKQYKDLEVDQVEEVEVTDDDVEEQAQTELKELAEEVEITDRPVENGDWVYIDYVGSSNGTEFEGGSAEDYALEIGSGTFIDGFEDQIIGHELGETFDIDVTFPSDYSSYELAGADATFKITINKIIYDDVPELTDEIVPELASAGDATTVNDYYKNIREDLQSENETEYRQSLLDEIWEVLSDEENCEITSYPEGRQDEIKQDYIDQYTSYAEAYGMTYEDFLTDYMSTTVKEFEESLDEYAKEQLEQEIIIEAIADKEGIAVTDDNYETELQRLADENGYELDDLKETYADQEDVLKSACLNNLVGDWLVDNCIQVAS